MTPFHVLFGSNKQIEYKNQLIDRYFELTEVGEYKIKFTFIESNSDINQAIVLFFCDFSGEYYLENKLKQIKNNRFPQEHFWIDTSPKEFNVTINLLEGKIMICNGSDLLGDKCYCNTLHAGCAMHTVKISENRYRFFCNDHELDDDFNDLIFEMEILHKE